MIWGWPSKKACYSIVLCSYMSFMGVFSTCFFLPISSVLSQLSVFLDCICGLQFQPPVETVLPNLALSLQLLFSGIRCLL